MEALAQDSRRVIVGTAGHIDHGKTALVRALTGIDTDRLKEEKERGITIDIGFASLALDDTRFGFVDVPGHERFVKNMLAGVHGIDLVLLVIAADESVMPQTREHFEICRLLRIRRGLVVVTKTDLVERAYLELVEEEIRDFVSGSFLEAAPIIPVSAKTGEGVERLKQDLLRVARDLPLRDCGAVARMPVDRVFSVKGFGTVVTGTLISGTIEVGRSLELLPQGIPTAARGLQVYGTPVGRARAGERTAINLQNVSVEQVARGDLLAETGRLEPTSVLDVRLQLLKTAPQPVSHRARVRLHHGAAELLARAVLLDRAELRPGDDGLVQFRLERPAAFACGDRFIIRRYSPQLTIGGGEVIDPLPEKHRAFSAVRVDARRLAAWLQDLERAPADRKLLLWIEAAGERGMTAVQLGTRLGWRDEQLKSALSRWLSGGDITEIATPAGSYYSGGTLLDLKQRMEQVLDQFHRRSPLSAGMSREELRHRLLPGIDDGRSTAVLNHLYRAADVIADHDLVRRSSHCIELSAQEADAESRILAALRREGLQTSRPEELLARLAVEPELGMRLLLLAQKRGDLIRLGEHFYAREPLNLLVARLRELKAEEPKIDVSRFKDLTGLSRKFAIPLLEHLDRIRVTRRVGDSRIIL